MAWSGDEFFFLGVRHQLPVCWLYWEACQVIIEAWTTVYKEIRDFDKVYVRGNPMYTVVILEDYYMLFCPLFGRCQFSK
jgi:hypothetical protein